MPRTVKHRIEVGDRVVTHYRQALAKVIEDRGNLGGGRIVRIRLLPQEPNPKTISSWRSPRPTSAPPNPEAHAAIRRYAV